MPSVEIAQANLPRGPFRAVVFDFDGTLSLLRRNWQETMIPMMVEVLAATGTRESPAELAHVVEDFVMRLNGRQTIYQMIQLADEVQKRGGTPREPLEYKHAYHERLWREVSGRIAAVSSGQTPAEEFTVPGSLELLKALEQAGLTLCLASGTDVNYVRSEAAVLGLDRFFGPRIHGAIDDYKNFSKALVVQRLIAELGLRPGELAGFGDGFVEIEEVRKVQGLAIGVASDEMRRVGMNAWKRQRLLSAGAHAIVGDYRDLPAVLNLLGLACA